MNIVFMGTPEFAVASLSALCASERHQVVGIVTVPDKPSGRGQNLSESAVKKFALEQQLPILQPAKLRDADFLNQLQQWHADLFVVVAFRWLPREVWSMPPLGTINLHGSLLPQYRGAAPINRAVMNGDSETGVTTFLIDKEIDTGRILMSEKMPIGFDEDAGSVHDRMMNIGAELLIRTLDAMERGTIEPQPQELLMREGETLRPAPKIFKEDCCIDWRLPALNIYHQIRGLSPYPGAFTHLKTANGAERTLKIYQARCSDQHHETVKAGTIKTEKNRLLIACQDAFLELIDIQIDGKKRLKTADFLRGTNIAEFSIDL